MAERLQSNRLLTGSMGISVLIALLQLALHVTFHGNYNYFRDELYYIACSDHLAWGYVDEPPLSLAILAVSRWVAGDSLHAIRFLAALACAGVVILAALVARRMGGGRFSQGLAALTVVAAHVLLGNGRYYSMNAFDVFFWALAVYIVVGILDGDPPKRWLLFGTVIGLGLMNKYSIGFLCIGLFAGMLLSPHRRHLGSKWFWSGAGIASVIFLPHIIWEISNGFPSIEFMGNASQNKNVGLSVGAFFTGQLREVNYFNAPIWLLGLYFFLFDAGGRRFRPFGVMYLVVFVVMVAQNAKLYYLSPAYPVLLAGGSVIAERLLRNLSWSWLKPAYVGLLIVWSAIASPFVVPILPVDQFIAYQRAIGVTPRAEERSSVGVLPQYYADEFGWEEMVDTIACIYRTLTPEEQAQCVIFVRNYGEAGAIDFFGKTYGLPKSICAHNNYWLWGPGTKTGNVAIIIGHGRDLQGNLDDLRRRYAQVELAGTTHCVYCMPYENGRQIFICRGMNTSFQALWPHERFYI